ncbi:MAG: HAD-IIB family hydrolase [Acidobacteria bacterium]|nr:HAD-IIB family hydrolase [Acidobacteriota bacterium]
MAKLVIFTDLDGTLLEEGSQAAGQSREALLELEGLGVPLIFASAKTQAEILQIQTRLKVKAPFIAENGSAVFIPKGYFPFGFQSDRSTSTHWVIEMGTPYRELRRFLSEVPPIPGLTIQGFGDMGIEEVGSLTGLGPAAAARAMAREYDETLVLDGPAEAIGRFEALARSRGLRVTHGGAFHHILGNCDKGLAALVLCSLFVRRHGRIFSAALGNAKNDLPLLAAVNLPVLLGGKIRVKDDFRSSEKLLPHHADSWGQGVNHILRASRESDPI